MFDSVSPDWHVAGIGDFNGDGYHDILWRNDNGLLSDWIGLPDNAGFWANDLNALQQVPVDWHVVATGDFNGEDRHLAESA